jgi:hypothetical protein
VANISAYYDTGIITAAKGFILGIRLKNFQLNILSGKSYILPILI